MLREWVGNGYVTRDHFNFNGRETFPLAISPLSSGGTTNSNTATEAIRNSVQSPDTVTEVTITESESPSPTDSERAATAGETAYKSISVSVTEFVSFAQRLLKKIRQRLSL